MADVELIFKRRNKKVPFKRKGTYRLLDILNIIDDYLIELDAFDIVKRNNLEDNIPLNWPINRSDITEVSAMKRRIENRCPAMK